MPALSLTETVVALVVALGAGGGAVVAARRKPLPGTPEDHELRLQRLEAADKECDERITRVEARMSAIETSVAGQLGRLTATVEKLAESVDNLSDCVNEIDFEKRVEREVEKRLGKRHRSKSDTDPSDKE